MKFRFEIETDAAEVSKVLDALGGGVMQAALGSPQIMGLIGQFTQAVAAPERRAVSPRPASPWATPEARAAAEAEAARGARGRPLTSEEFANLLSPELREAAGAMGRKKCDGSGGCGGHGGPSGGGPGTPPAAPSGTSASSRN